MSEFLLHIPKNIAEAQTTSQNGGEATGWEIKVSSEKKIFESEQIEDGTRFLRRWSKVFPKEETYVQRELAIPSLIVRLDCAVRDGALGIYEVEERPSGIGLTTVINEDFKQNLEDIRATWPNFASVVSTDERRKATDDYLWLETYDPERDELVLVRAEPDEEAYHYLEPRSVSSLKRKGDKSYGEQLGLWRRVTSPDEIDFAEEFVIKPLQGSKTRDVFIYVPGSSSKRPPGAATRNRIEQAIFSAAELGGVYCQPYFAPMESEISREYQWMIYRVFYGYNVEKRDWECLGGSWNARYNLKIHGASDSLSGAVIAEK